jgi:hypothetical protein
MGKPYVFLLYVIKLQDKQNSAMYKKKKKTQDA